MPGTETDRHGLPVASPAPQPATAPRELRAQAVKRLQVGLLGLATMLLLVALANIIMERARMADSAAGPLVSSRMVPSSSSGADPLADLGVIPSPDPHGPRGRSPATH